MESNDVQHGDVDISLPREATGAYFPSMSRGRRDANESRTE